MCFAVVTLYQFESSLDPKGIATVALRGTSSLQGLKAPWIRKGLRLSKPPKRSLMLCLKAPWIRKGLRLLASDVIEAFGFESVLDSNEIET